MSDPTPDHVVIPPHVATSGMNRRRFLAGLGLVGGGFLLSAVPRGLRGSRPTRLETARPALGTWVRVTTVDTDPGRATRAIDAAFAAVAAVDAQMSIHRPDSQLSRVNAAAGNEDVAVDWAVADVVSRARDAAVRTRGEYDPTILPLMRLYGFYGASRDRYPSDREIAAALDVTGHRFVSVDTGARRVGLTRRGAALDLGSIGKGWALDRAVDAIRREGVASALVDVGGNVYGLGAPDPDASGWSVAVVHPVTGRLDRRFTLRDEAIGTSGNAEQHHRLGRVDVGHLLDACAGRPASGPRSATVRARTGVDSDLLSTVAFLLGPDRFRGEAGALETHYIG